MKNHGPQPRAFTLVEVLVVMAIVTLLASIALPVGSRVIGAARGAACLTNLRSLGQSTALFRAEHKDLYPAAGAVVSLPLGRTALLDALGPYVDSARPTMGEDGACHTGDPFRCAADRVCAPVHGMSYLYELGDLMEVLAIDGERDPARAATLFAEHDPGAAIFSDMGERELAQLGARAWHGGGPGNWRNAVYSDGRAARLAAAPGGMVE